MMNYELRNKTTKFLRCFSLFAFHFSLLFLVSSCVTYEKCQNKFGISADTIVKVNTVVVPGDSIITYIASTPLSNPDTIRITDPKSRARINYWYDQYRKAIAVTCICDSVVVHDTIKIPVIRDKYGGILAKAEQCPYLLYVTLLLVAILTAIGYVLLRK